MVMMATGYGMVLDVDAIILDSLGTGEQFAHEYPNNNSYAIPQSQADDLLAALTAAGLRTAVQVGEVIEGPYGIQVV